MQSERATTSRRNRSTAAGWSFLFCALVGCSAGTSGSNREGGGGQGGATAADAPSLDRGRVMLRRLNRTEYNNTVRDLLGTALRPADKFPGDDVDHGFDTIGAAVHTSPVHLELMESAASALVDELLARPANDEQRARILLCDDPGNDCLARVLEGFMRRAYRRPPVKAEVTDLLALADEVRTQTSQPDDGRRAALTAVLVSPHFLFRVEHDADLDDTEARPISNHELAARLSYFLWATMPDDELLEAADDDRLSDTDELRRQVERMLSDGKAVALAENFAGQWLYTRSIEEFAPLSSVFPAFDEPLRAAMKEETERLFGALVQDGATVADLLMADFTFVNDRLARHYGVPSPGGGDFARVSLAGTPRGGLLTQGSFLLVTSPPDRTSPVKRGAWVLHQLMCSLLPPPPPDVEALEVPTKGDGTTLRDRLAEHRSNPACAGCHNLLDPIGFGLENFDGIGTYRTQDNGVAIDASGEMPDGQSFTGARELGQLVAGDAAFAGCVAQQLATYGLGRPFDGEDGAEYLAGLVARVGGADSTLPALLLAIVTSEAFRTRRAEIAQP